MCQYLSMTCATDVVESKLRTQKQESYTELVLLEKSLDLIFYVPRTQT